MPRKERNLGKKLRRDEQLESRRSFLKRGAIVLGGLAAGGVLLKTLSDRENVQDIDGLRRRVSFPEYSLDQRDALTFISEGWLGELKIDLPQNLSSLTSEKRREIVGLAVKSIYEEVLGKMSNSVYKSFRDVAERLNQGKKADEEHRDGAIRPLFVYLNGENQKPILDILFATRPSLDQNNYWVEELYINLYTWDPAFPQHSSAKTYANWATGMAHEVLGHCFLDENLFNFWRNKGLTKDQSVRNLRSDTLQEPFAYAVQGSVTFPILDLEFQGKKMRSMLPLSSVQITDQWAILKKKEVNWYDQEWVSFINKYWGSN